MAALEQLSSRAQAGGSEWALGLVARSRALTTVGSAAEEHYTEAIERLGRSRMAAYLARTHLLYGEWLRRGGRGICSSPEPRVARVTTGGVCLDGTVFPGGAPAIQEDT